jgi:hypothetical protein
MPTYSSNPIVVTSLLIINRFLFIILFLITMGNCLSCISVYSDMWDMTLLMREDDTRRPRYSEERRFHNEKSDASPLQNDLAKINR